MALLHDTCNTIYHKQYHCHHLIITTKHRNSHILKTDYVWESKGDFTEICRGSTAHSDLQQSAIIANLNKNSFSLSGLVHLTGLTLRLFSIFHYIFTLNNYQKMRYDYNDLQSKYLPVHFSFNITSPKCPALFCQDELQI